MESSLIYLFNICHVPDVVLNARDKEIRNTRCLPLNILQSHEETCGWSSNPSALCCVKTDTRAGANGKAANSGGRQGGREGAQKPPRGSGARAGSPRMGWELSEQRGHSILSSVCAGRQADCRKVCGSPYGCGLSGVTGIAGEMGRSHPLKSSVLKILNFIWKLSGDRFNQKWSCLHFRFFFLARV